MTTHAAFPIMRGACYAVATSGAMHIVYVDESIPASGKDLCIPLRYRLSVRGQAGSR